MCILTTRGPCHISPPVEEHIGTFPSRELFLQICKYDWLNSGVVKIKPAICRLRLKTLRSGKT